MPETLTPTTTIIVYEMWTLDDCTCEFQYCIDAAGALTCEEGTWTPQEPELHTTGVAVSRRDANGSHHELLLELSGEQHRQLEDGGELEVLIRRLADGTEPASALKEVLGPTATAW